MLTQNWPARSLSGHNPRRIKMPSKDDLKKRVEKLTAEIEAALSKPVPGTVAIPVDLMERLIASHGSNNPADLRAVVQTVREEAERQYPERWRK